MSSDELDVTAIRRIKREILEATSDEAPSRDLGGGFESAELVYRAVVSLRDLLAPETQQQLAVCFEWAREGIVRQTAGEVSGELAALHAAYAYARDAMLEAVKRNGISR